MRDPNDTAAPVVVLDAATGDPLLRDGVVTGTVRDTNLDSWTLEIQRLGDDTFQHRRDRRPGRSTAARSPRSTWPTMPNGFYVLRLTARDIGGRLARTEAVVEVRTADEARLHADRDRPDRQPRRHDRRRRARVRLDAPRPGRQVRQRLAAAQPRARHPHEHAADRPRGPGPLSAVPRWARGSTSRRPNGDEVGFQLQPGPPRRTGRDLLHARLGACCPRARPAGRSRSPGVKLMKAGSLFFELTTGRPYNPASPFFQGEDFALTGPDGTRYGVDVALGVVSQHGARRRHRSTSATAAWSPPAASRVQFVYDTSGRIERLVAPDGRVRRLHLRRRRATWSPRGRWPPATSSRYGYDPADHAPARHGASRTDGTGTAVVYSPTGPPAVAPDRRQPRHRRRASRAGPSPGTLAAGASDRHAFSVRASEIAATATGEVLVRVAVRATSGTLQPAVPQIAGLTPRSTFQRQRPRRRPVRRHARGPVPPRRSAARRAPRATTRCSSPSPATSTPTAPSTASTAPLMAGGPGHRRGPAGYVFAADLDGSGVIDATDTQILARNYGFRANRAPQANPALPGR